MHWPAAGFVDTGLRQSNLPFKLNWADVADGRVPAYGGVEPLDVTEHLGPHMVASPIDCFADALGFQRREEAHHCRVVPDVSGSAHRTGTPLWAISCWNYSPVYWADSIGRRNDCKIVHPMKAFNASAGVRQFNAFRGRVFKA